MSLLFVVRTLVALGGVALVIDCAATETNRPPAQFKKIDSGTYASLSAGKVKVLGYPRHRARFDVAEEIELVKLNIGPAGHTDAIRKNIGSGEITQIYVPDTFYSFILLDGAVQPLILDMEKWEVWHIAGLGKHFSKCRSIVAGQKRIGFGGVKGLADIWLDWSFDFTGREQGLVVRFKAEGGA